MDSVCLFVTGVGLFVGTATLTVMSARRRTSKVSSLVVPSKAEAERLVALIEERVQRDEGGRGIGELVLPRGELFNAAEALLESTHVAILSGFPCMLKFTPPTETDGPLGSMAIARALLALGKTVTILTDECNEGVFLACGAESGLQSYQQRGRLMFESFPGAAEFDDQDSIRLQQVGAACDLVVAIERAGPAEDGLYYTMRGFDMTALVAPLDDLLQPPPPPPSPPPPTRHEEASEGEGGLSSLLTTSRSAPIKSIGIGDGGNEVGMGKIYQRILESRVPNAQQIACVVPTTHLLVCSVSNWGGYALAAAAALIASFRQQRDARALLREFLPSDDEERRMCSRMVEEGARDGVSGLLECSVDGMPLEASLDVLRCLRDVL
jgi:hypothetical protein